MGNGMGGVTPDTSHSPRGDGAFTPASQHPVRWLGARVCVGVCLRLPLPLPLLKRLPLRGRRPPIWGGGFTHNLGVGLRGLGSVKDRAVSMGSPQRDGMGSATTGWDGIRRLVKRDGPWVGTEGLGERDGDKEGEKEAGAPG